MPWPWQRERAGKTEAKRHAGKGQPEDAQIDIGKYIRLGYISPSGIVNFDKLNQWVMEDAELKGMDEKAVLLRVCQVAVGIAHALRKSQLKRELTKIEKEDLLELVRVQFSCWLRETRSKYMLTCEKGGDVLERSGVGDLVELDTNGANDTLKKFRKKMGEKAALKKFFNQILPAALKMVKDNLKREAVGDEILEVADSVLAQTNSWLKNTGSKYMLYVTTGKDGKPAIAVHER
jgi:hypothetical protein